MEQQHSQGNTMMFRASRRIPRMLCLYTATAIYCNLPVFKWLIVIKQVYVTLATLWKFFHYFPKRVECPRGVAGAWSTWTKRSFKPSNTHILASTQTVCKGSERELQHHCECLNNIYNQTHKPEVLGIRKAFVSPQLYRPFFFSIMLKHKLPSWADLSRQIK